MCGIAGIFSAREVGDRELDVLEAMNRRLAHRGPDAYGIWSNREAGIGLAHRRLSIIDLSKAGAQPMHSESGRLTIVFNGEIYNFEELRAALSAARQPPAWRGHSDTEVFVAAIEHWGLDEALGRCRGMYAFALWDATARSVTLGRDPMGEKPLFVSRISGGIAFASELKALMCHPDFNRTYDRDAVALSIRHGFIPAPRTLFAETFKIEPGQLITFAADKLGVTELWRSRFFDLTQVETAGHVAQSPGESSDAVAALDALLSSVVERQMISDVPLGAFLSGGVDSSLITSFMARLAGQQVETFTVGFEEARFDESTHAREIARHLGVRNNAILLTGNSARDIVMDMPDVYDEPFTDASQLPTFLLSRFARERVTVCLSGDGGDELFAGYGRYHSFLRKWNSSALEDVERLAQLVYRRAALRGFVQPLIALGARSLAGRSLLTQEIRLTDWVNKNSEIEPLRAYERRFTNIDCAEKLVRGAHRTQDPLLATIDGRDWSVLRKITTLDMLRYLPDDILVKVDRAAMANSLETRLPLLDPEIVQFAASLGDNVKMMHGERKGILKALLARYVPRHLWDRPKQGFGIPTGEWLKGPLHELAADMFSEASLERTGVFEPQYVHEYWRDFLHGSARGSSIIWRLFIVQLYLYRLDEQSSSS